MVLDLGEGFTSCFGKANQQMPLLKRVEKRLVSVDFVLQQQFAYPETWGKTSFLTGDGVARGIDGDVIIDLDSALLLDVNPLSTFYEGALALNRDNWVTLKENLQNLYLTREQVEEADGTGYVKKDGRWKAENRSVAEVLYVLGRGRDLTSHAEFASQKSGGAKKVLIVSFDQDKSQVSRMRAWFVSNLRYGSNAFGKLGLCLHYDPLVGVVSEAFKSTQSIARDPAFLKNRLEAGLKQYVAPANLDEVVRYTTNEAIQFASRT